MNGHGKSDRPVVPANLPNKAVAAEAGGKGASGGEHDQQTTPRTQRRARCVTCAGSYAAGGSKRIGRHGLPRCCTTSMWVEDMERD